MSDSDIESLIFSYYAWVKDKTAYNHISNKWTVITTPYQDHHNDYIQIYLQKTDDGFFLTDDGETISGLSEEGCLFECPKQQKLLQMILNYYDVDKEFGRLYIKTTVDNFAPKMHSLINTIIEINHKFYFLKLISI